MIMQLLFSKKHFDYGKSTVWGKCASNRTWTGVLAVVALWTDASLFPNSNNNTYRNTNITWVAEPAAALETMLYRKVETKGEDYLPKETWRWKDAILVKMLPMQALNTKTDFPTRRHPVPIIPIMGIPTETQLEYPEGITWGQHVSSSSCSTLHWQIIWRYWMAAPK